MFSSLEYIFTSSYFTFVNAHLMLRYMWHLSL